jgi:hypothetical protein
MSFVDNTFIPRWHNSLQQLIIDIERFLEAITKQLRDSSIKVNQSKTKYAPSTNIMLGM